MKKLISNSVKAVFEHPDFDKHLRVLAEELGEDATLSQINFCYQQNRPVPAKIINGKQYIAGYRGGAMVDPGKHTGRLIDIKVTGKHCKFMFAINGLNVFLYYNVNTAYITTNEIIAATKSIGEIFPVTVEHESIPATGELHAVITKVTGFEFAMRGIKEQ